MIKLKKVTCKNFLSYGNVPTEFILDQHLATLMRGKNGHGKSALMDLILYALYGKPYRDISKPQLINSINKSGMVVTIEFSIGASEYKIVRGMKPNIFDIFCDDELVEQNAAMRDYQEFLESQILKMSERTFKQIAVLGSASYIPFMQLNASQRRELVESILDIEVFSRMNLILKDRIAATKEEAKTIDHRLELKKTEAVAQKRLIGVMQDNTKARVVEYENQRAKLLLDLAAHGTTSNNLQEELDQLVEPDYDASKYEAVTTSISAKVSRINSLDTRIKSLHTMDECPTCMQAVSENHIHHTGAAFKQEITVYRQDLVLLNAQKEALEIERSVLYEYLDEHKRVSNLLIASQREVATVRKQIATVDDSIKSILTNTDNVEAEQEKLKGIGEAALKIIARKNALSEEKHLQDVAAQLLKDTGIKTAVVKEYLPIMNTLINKYLSMFNFFVDFTLDESFSEVIKSRGRDVFTYSSFSEGEKRRIDFAILMAFRQLAAMKNSAKTNILILDEIVDGAFDLDARASFNDLIVSIPDSNVIVISHADASTESYDRVIHVEKPNDFSVYTIME
jgi:DNA repair exonuclease SbcCD ATPase subunit